jgi:phosphoglycerate dehydrogenase-like enzyme
VVDPFVIAVMGPFDSPEFFEALRSVDPRVEVVWLPYFESTELRTAKGLNQGRDPHGHEVPEISIDDQAKLARANAIIAMDLPAKINELAPNLQWFQGISAGFEHLGCEQLRDMGVAQTAASGIGAVPIAEFVIGRLLQVWKHLRELDARQIEHNWDMLYGTQMQGRVIGVIGLGAIGREVAVRAKAFGMTVLATRASAKPGDVDPDVDELFPAYALDDILPSCDVVVLTLPSTPELTDLMDSQRIGLMAEGAILVNVSRGIHVVEPDLIAALHSGRLSAAILDVTRFEPLPEDDPLWEAPNLYLSPHSAVSLDRYEATLTRLVRDNLGRLLRGDALRNVVNDQR